MRCRFVDAEKAHYPVAMLCRMMRFSAKTYYAWRRRGESPRKIEDRRLLDRIRTIFRDSRETYGSPRVHAALVAEGLPVGRHRVARLMRQDGLCGRRRRAFRPPRTTLRDPAHPVAPNVLERDFVADGPNEKWVTDVSFIPTDEGWLYLATILDLYNREVVGWSMGETNDQQLTRRALQMALQSHRPPRGMIHHSDRGSTYTANDYRALLAEHGIVCSMSRRGDCWDNSVAESFYATLKKELVNRTNFRTREAARAAIFEYIEVFYNRVRLHSTLGYRSPVDYRNRTAARSAG